VLAAFGVSDELQDPNWPGGINSSLLRTWDCSPAESTRWNRLTAFLRGETKQFGSDCNINCVAAWILDVN
jgi:hypothetical protein